MSSLVFSRFSVPDMLVSVFLAPTTYSEWVVFLLKSLLDCKFESHYHIVANTLNDLRGAWDQRDGRAVLITTDWPDSELSSFIIDSKFPFCVVMDDPLPTFMARFSQMGPIESIRVATGHLATLSPAIVHERAIKIDARFLQQSLETLLGALSVSLFGEVHFEVIDAVVAKVAANEPGAVVRDLVERYHGVERNVDAIFQSLTAKQRAAVAAVSQSYGRLLTDGELKWVNWPLELFNFNVSGYNLIGGGRTIVSGPFLCLPAGTWRAIIQCETAENFSGNEIGAEIWFPPNALAVRGFLTLPIRGIFNLSLDFEVKNSASRIEICIYLLKGAIEGRLKICSVAVEKTETRAATVSHFLTRSAKA